VAVAADVTAGGATVVLAVAVRLGVAVSVTVIDWAPVVSSVAENACVPALAVVKVYLAGRTAWGSLLVKAS
jgi:hypothetical protein